jgi:hypothetical protein
MKWTRTLSIIGSLTGTYLPICLRTFIRAPAPIHLAREMNTQPLLLRRMDTSAPKEPIPPIVQMMEDAKEREVLEVGEVIPLTAVMGKTEAMTAAEKIIPVDPLDAAVLSGILHCLTEGDPNPLVL